MDERVRIIDIARELGLSTATVSNVIHGKTNKMSKETVKRVQELLEKRSYVPSMAGILLAQNNSRIIGVAVNDHPKYGGKVLEDAYIASCLNALAVETKRAGYFLMVQPVTDWKEIARYASMWNMDGVVLIGFCEEDYCRLRDNMHIPFVVYDGYFEENQRICNLFVDNYGGGYLVGEYLYRMGHRKVLCIADNDICMDKERIVGCRAGMKDGQTDFLQIPWERKKRKNFYREHLEEIRSYTAIFAASDVYAIDVMNFLQKSGVKIPEEISVIGFDNIPLCEMVWPGLTTISQDTAERAKRAVEALQELRRNECEKAFQILPVKLVIRDSVAKR